MSEKKFEYTITLTSKQALEVQNALEAIMRWKLKQPEIMREYLPDRLDWSHGAAFDISLAKRNAATELLKSANDLLMPYNYANWNVEPPLKDEQWYRIYNIFQVIRHAIWEAERDHTYYSADGQEPFSSGGEDLPQIEWKEKND